METPRFPIFALDVDILFMKTLMKKIPNPFQEPAMQNSKEEEIHSLEVCHPFLSVSS